jgi:hypothetical protein
MAEKTGIERDILEQTIQAVAQETGVRLQITGREVPMGGNASMHSCSSMGASGRSPPKSGTGCNKPISAR